jgi:hypothetical protein
VLSLSRIIFEGEFDGTLGVEMAPWRQPAQGRLAGAGERAKLPASPGNTTGLS